MSCDVTKFSITKGVDNTFSFTIKQDNSTLALVIEPTDTFVAKLIPLNPSDSSSYNFSIPTPTVSDGTNDYLNGKIVLEIDTTATNILASEVGSKVDRYYIRPMYKLIIDCVTTNNGNFIAKVDEVFVD